MPRRVFLMFLAFFLNLPLAHAGWIWNHNYQATISASTLKVEIGVAPHGDFNRVGVVYSRDGGATWTARDASWSYNEPSPMNPAKMDEVWTDTHYGFSMGNVIVYALWAELKDGSVIWDNNSGANYTTQVADTDGPEFYTPGGYFDYSIGYAHPTEHVINGMLSGTVMPWRDVVIDGMSLQDDLSGVGGGELIYSADAWASSTTAAKGTRTAWAPSKYGTTVYFTDYQFDLGGFDPGTTVDFYLHAWDSRGNDAYLPADWTSFSFTVPTPAANSVWVGGVTYDTATDTLLIDVYMDWGTGHSMGVAWATASPVLADISNCASFTGTWSFAAAVWIENKSFDSLTYEHWQASIAGASSYGDIFRFAAKGDFGDGTVAWDNNGGDDYLARLNYQQPFMAVELENGCRIGVIER